MPMVNSMSEKQLMNVWIFRLAQIAAARMLYDSLPENLKDGAELRTDIEGAELRTPSNEAADWVRGHVKEALKAA
ncbi:MAG: hypothetical protein GC145_17685 [Caulobacter sp.]|nr:hypothetical protein [Caulobacter sp.]